MNHRSYKEYSGATKVGSDAKSHSAINMIAAYVTCTLHCHHLSAPACTSSRLAITTITPTTAALHHPSHHPNHRNTHCTNLAITPTTAALLHCTATISTISLHRHALHLN
jgi:hypothetical protein